jgi:uncharacterized protein YqeY
MTIEERLNVELVRAMKAHDTNVLDCVRMVKSKLSERRTSPGFTGGITDVVAMEVIDAYSRSIRKALGEFATGGLTSGPMVDKYKFEIEYLAQYLPQKLDEAATRDLVRLTIAEQGISGLANVGRLMGAIMKGHKDVVDSAMVKRIAEEELRPPPA